MTRSKALRLVREHGRDPGRRDLGQPRWPVGAIGIVLTWLDRRPMDAADIHLRNLTYGHMRTLGRAPTAVEVAAAAGSTVDDVQAGWRRLHDAHALVLNQATAELRMLNPFSTLPSAYRVHADGRWWYGNCAWDAFGILGALHADGLVETSCPDCGEAVAV